MFLLKPRARNTNQMCAGEGTQVMRGSPHPALPLNDRMQLLQCFPGCRLLSLQNKRGEDEGGSRGPGDEGHHLMPLIASQADILQRHREARIQGTGRFAAAALPGAAPRPPITTSPAPAALRVLVPLPLPGSISLRAIPLPPPTEWSTPARLRSPGQSQQPPRYERDHVGLGGQLSFPWADARQRIRSCTAPPWEVYEPRALKPPSSQVGLFNPAASTTQ